MHGSGQHAGYPSLREIGFARHESVVNMAYWHGMRGMAMSHGLCLVIILEIWHEHDGLACTLARLLFKQITKNQGEFTRMTRFGPTWYMGRDVHKPHRVIVAQQHKSDTT